jgi:hypothetical protein
MQRDPKPRAGGGDMSVKVLLHVDQLVVAAVD